MVSCSDYYGIILVTEYSVIYMSELIAMKSKLFPKNLIGQVARR